eukprot:11106879-Karenia_brevis.AAC.1
MAICESQLLEYSRSLTKRNKFYIGKKSQNFDDPPTRDDGDQRGPQPSQGAASSASGGIAPK